MFVWAQGEAPTTRAVGLFLVERIVENDYEMTNFEADSRARFVRRARNDQDPTFRIP